MNTPLKPICYFLVGLPGSGKSTWVAKNAPDAIIISSDQYIEQRAAAQGKTYGDVFKDEIKAATAEMNATLENAIICRLPIVWDQTNMNAKTRATKLAKLKNYNVVAVAFEISQDELNSRLKKRDRETGKAIPGHIMKSMAASYQRPTVDEGFSKVIIIK